MDPWNALPSGVRAVLFLASFRQKLKQTLFLRSFPDERLATLTVCLYIAPGTVYNCDSVTLISSLVIIIIIIIIIMMMMMITTTTTMWCVLDLTCYHWNCKACQN